ncbi:DUF475 domain-containing protein [Candidatus Saccharibacteria bacterium]|nr:DUF475 domain-containing protein [Candidatus Saccharibacteria bacterium]
MREHLKHFSWSIITSAIVTLTVLYYLGFGALAPLLTLIVIEITFSFDNAVVNAKILKKLSPLWQQLFLTVGILIAIFGMRLVFPVLIVALTAHLPWHDVIDLALNHPEVYAHKLELAHPTITAFGGSFLLMLCLHFFIEEDKKHHWIEWLERPMNHLGAWWTPLAMTTLVVLGISWLPGNEHATETLRAGLIGIMTYLAIQGIMYAINFLTRSTSESKHYVGWAAFTMFVYLQVLDASFSLDGVLGAFAISSDIILIAAGLGIGALWVRSMTVYMVRRGTLEAYRYLEHGAHYAIGVLAVSMLGSVIFEIPEFVTGGTGLFVIGASVVASLRAKRV